MEGELSTHKFLIALGKSLPKLGKRQAVCMDLPERCKAEKGLKREEVDRVCLVIRELAQYR